MSVCKGFCPKTAPLFKRKHIALDLLEAANCQSANRNGLDVRDSREPAHNSQSCLGRKLSKLILTLTLIVMLTLPSFAELRKELCLAGVDVKEREDKEGSASSGYDHGSGTYSWDSRGHSVGKDYICDLLETL